MIILYMLSKIMDGIIPCPWINIRTHWCSHWFFGVHTVVTHKLFALSPRLLNRCLCAFLLLTYKIIFIFSLMFIFSFKRVVKLTEKEKWRGEL